MEFVVRAKWNYQDTLEVFYCAQQRCFALKNLGLVRYVYLEDPSEFFQINLEMFTQIINREKLVSYQQSWMRNIISFQITCNEIEVYNQEQKSIYTLKVKDGGELMGYHWVSGSQVCDFFLVTNRTLELYKYKKILKKVKTLHMEIGYYWYHSGIILIGIQKQNQTEFRVFNMKQTKNFKGRIFHQEFVFENQRPNYNRNLLQQTGFSHQKNNHSILASIYDQLYFFYADFSQGKVILQNVLQGDFRQVIDMIPDIYQLRVVHNLLIIQCYIFNQSFIFDLQKDIFKLFTVVQHPHNEANPRFSSQKIVQHSYTQSLIQLNQNLLNIDTDLCLSQSTYVYQYVLIPQTLIQSHPNPAFTLNFLTRRQHTKKELFKLLQSFISQEIDLSFLRDFFQYNLKCYSQASQNLLNLQEFADSSKEIKLQSGQTPILQTEWSRFFQSYQKKFPSSLYFTTVLLLYHLTAQNFNIHIHPDFNQILQLSLIRLQQFKTLGLLVSYSVLIDSQELAFVLIENGNFNTGLDILHRKKDWTTIASLLVENDFLLEAEALIKQHNLSQQMWKRVFRVISDQQKRALQNSHLQGSFLPTKKPKKIGPHNTKQAYDHMKEKFGADYQTPYDKYDLHLPRVENPDSSESAFDRYHRENNFKASRRIISIFTFLLCTTTLVFFKKLNSNKKYQKKFQQQFELLQDISRNLKKPTEKLEDKTQPKIKEE